MPVIALLNTANQQWFPAVQQGTLVVQVPNEAANTELTLDGALHVPAISYTLVSIAALDEKRYHAHISGSHLELTCPQCERVSRIARIQGHLYRNSQRGEMQAGRAPALAAADYELVITPGLLIAWLLLQAQYVRQDCHGATEIRSA